MHHSEREKQTMSPKYTDKRKSYQEKVDRDIIENTRRLQSKLDESVIDILFAS